MIIMISEKLVFRLISITLERQNRLCIFINILSFNMKRFQIGRTWFTCYYTTKRTRPVQNHITATTCNSYRHRSRLFSSDSSYFIYTSHSYQITIQRKVVAGAFASNRLLHEA